MQPSGTRNPGQCEFATALEVITPPAPVRLACSGDFETLSTAIHDDQYVRVMALRSPDDHVLILVSYELLFFDRSLNRALAEHAQQRHGVDPACVTVGAVHNHNAGGVAGYNPGTSHAPQWPSDDDPTGYEELLLNKGIAAIDTAMAHLRPGQIELRRSHSELNINRRQKIGDQIVAGPNEAAPRDTELIVLSVTDHHGTLAACLVVWACHPVFYPERTVLTGEFPSRLCQLISAERYGCAPMFLQGAAGDVRPRATVVDGQFTPQPFAVIDEFSRALAAEVLTLLDEPGEPIDLAPCGVEFTVDLPLRVHDRDHFSNLVTQGPSLPHHPEWTNAVLIEQEYLNRPHQVSLGCSLVRLTPPDAAPLWLATVGGEPCNDIKNLVRAAIGEPVIFVGYTDSTAYIVSDRMLEEGGYEPTCAAEFGHLGPFAPGIDNRISSAFDASAQQLRQRR